MADGRIQAVVFDLDGTLIDSRDDIADAVNVALSRSGYEPLSCEEISRYVGDGAKLLVSRAARIPPDAPELERMIETFLDHYSHNATNRTRLVPHAEATLDALGLKYELALLTNKPRRTTDVVLNALSLSARFRVVIAGGDLPEKKPHPMPLLYIAEKLRMQPSALLMVGDGAQDVLAGRAAGALTVGVEGGFASRDDLLASKPDGLLRNLGELLPWITAQATNK